MSEVPACGHRSKPPGGRSRWTCTLITPRREQTETYLETIRAAGLSDIQMLKDVDYLEMVIATQPAQAYSISGAPICGNTWDMRPATMERMSCGKRWP